MPNVWTVARQTFMQCLRTKAAAVFTVLLAGSLLALPSLMEGDGTLAGRIRTFFDYSTTVTSVLLSGVVILLAVGVVTGDARGKHILVICTKPLKRWQYVVGRWLGIVLMGGLLLAGAAGAIYVLGQYLRGRSDLAVRPEDRRAVETEVFAARRKIGPDPPDVERIVQARVERKKNDGSWQSTLEAYETNYGISPAEARRRLIQDIRKDALAQVQSVGPKQSLEWTFSGVHAAGRSTKATGRVRLVHPSGALVEIRTDPHVVSKLVIFGPVQVNNVTGLVVGLWKDGFRVRFYEEDRKLPAVADLKRGSRVDILIEPTIQVSYKVSATQETAAQSAGEEGLTAAWQVENPETGYVYFVPASPTPVRQKATIIVPARVIDPQGRLRVRYINLSPTRSVTLLNKDMAVLVAVAPFIDTFIKTFVLMLMGLMFLAAMGVFAGTWLSFPVASLVCFVMLWVATTFRFLGRAIEMGIKYPDDSQIILAIHKVGNVLLGVMKVLLPNLEPTLGTNFLVDGLHVSWGYMGHAALLTLVVRGLLLIGLACIIFHRRELARVQV
ncbi:MAG: hypothetical protein J7M21_00840 [Planctomycetes bacterium]|nr:hypothetical protein [Planctomycetota bacterium]